MKLYGQKAGCINSDPKVVEWSNSESAMAESLAGRIGEVKNLAEALQAEAVRYSVLFVLALHVSVSEPGTHFVRFICGYLGLLFCAVSLGCGVLVVSYSVRPQSHIFAKWTDALCVIP